MRISVATMRWSVLLIAIAMPSVGSTLAADLADKPAAAGPTYEQDVRPILKASCFHCHGEEKELSGGLDLRLRRMAVSGGDSGAAIVPGKHDESLLFQYVDSGTMPPGDEQKLTAAQIRIIADWIDAGAPALHSEPDANPTPGVLLITEEERSLWSFRPIRKPAVPEVQTEHGPTTNPVDAFIIRKLQSEGLSPSREADRRSLIRRAAFDLTGLPPTPEDLSAYLADESPEAYARMIDRLLESPHYGERWGRHWLDVAGYADSEGYNDSDVIRDDAWSYRDYVIRAINEDKPWDQFIIEQLAGDELVAATHANAQALANRDPEALEKLTATGFLRLAPDGTGSRPDDQKLAQNQMITETIKIVSSSLLGITVGCAECHHHRFDPIPQEDFYRLRAVFAPVFDTEKWRQPAARRVAILSAEDKQKADEIEAQAKELDAKFAAERDAVLEIILERVLESIPDEKREYATEAFRTAVKERDDEQNVFLQDKYPMLGLLRTGTMHLFLARYKDGNDLKKRYETIQTEAADLRAKKPQPTYIRLATEDTSHVPDTFVFYRGDVSSPEGKPVAPGGLSVLAMATVPVSTGLTSADAQITDSEVAESIETASEPASTNTFAFDNPDLPTTGRRLAFARYLTSGQHPLVARVLVNRIWLHHFGRGLVETAGEFGIRGTPPSHPELLDWLAADFMEHGWRLKRLHRLIMASQTYRQRSASGDESSRKAMAVDSDNRLLWRMPVLRMEAEAVRDSILAVSGGLDRELCGPPLPVVVNAGGIVTVGAPDKTQKGPGGNYQTRRSIYVQTRRSQPVAMLDAFDAPQMEPNCELRVSSTVATQSLALLNSEFVLEQSEAFARRVLSEAKEADNLEFQVQHAWELAFGSLPKPEELAASVDFLQAQQEDFTARKLKEPNVKALATLCQVLYGSNKFLYVD